MDWFSHDRLMRALWRLPVWGPLARALALLGLPEDRVPPVEPQVPGPLDALVATGGLVAGAAAVDITPPDPSGVYLAGFSPDRRSTGVRDPLWARFLVLSDGRTPLLIGALDLIGLARPRVQRLRALLTADHPDSVWLASTHNHQSPDTLGLWGKAFLGALPVRTGRDPAYLEFLERRVVEAVRQAVAAARPARLYLAEGEFDRAGKLVHNERSPVIDRRLRVIHLTGEDGAGIGTLVQHACHPETLWFDNTLVSADFPAVCCREVEAGLGGVGLYVNGALGAMVSAAVGHQTPPQERERLVGTLGRALGRAALRLAERARRRGPCQEPAIAVARAPVVFPAEDNALYGLLHALRVVEARDLSGGLESEVSLARVGPATLVGVPGEPAPALGLELLARVSGAPRLLVGLCNDELGYLLPPEFFHDDAYAYEQTMSPGPLAAARLALALEGLEERVGRGGMGGEGGER